MTANQQWPPWRILIIVVVIAFQPFAVQAKEKVFVNSLGMAFVRISAGTFVMGSPVSESHRDNGEIQHRVTISQPYYLQTTEVTLGQWRKVMGKGLFHFFTRRKGPDNLPVFRTCYHDAVDFLKKLNALGEGRYRLPTEAEWEYAARAGTQTAFSWGGRIDCSKAMFANKQGRYDQCVDDVGRKHLPTNGPAPVKSFQPNPWGLYDMHGNVWEWCSDWFGAYDPDPVVDPQGLSEGMHRVRRGGSWFGNGHKCRSANRAYGHPDSRLRNTGFRVVKVVEP